MESDSLQFPKCNQRNGAWNSIAVTCYFQRFSEPFESEECTNCYHLKLAPDTSLENCIWQRNEGVIPATQIFFIPNFLIYLLLPPFFPTDPSFFSLPPPSLTRPYSYSISFFALPPFLSPLPLLLCRSKSSFLSPPPPTLFHLSTVYFFFSLLLPSLPFLSVFIFGFFHNFAPMRYVLTGQWVSGEHLPPVSSSILYHPNAGWHRICHGAWTR